MATAAKPLKKKYEKKTFCRRSKLLTSESHPPKTCSQGAGSVGFSTQRGVATPSHRIEKDVLCDEEVVSL